MPDTDSAFGTGDARYEQEVSAALALLESACSEYIALREFYRTPDFGPVASQKEHAQRRLVDNAVAKLDDSLRIYRNAIARLDVIKARKYDTAPES